MDHNQTVLRVIEACRDIPSASRFTVVDYKETFDSIETNAILLALVDQRVDGSYVRTLADCYYNCNNGAAFLPFPYNSSWKRGTTR